MADAGSTPLRRSSDMGPRSRLRRWWTVNGVQVTVFALLAVIIAGEASDFFNDREQERGEARMECVVGNLSETTSESLRRLRVQAPVIEAAGKIITAETPEERVEAEGELRAAVRDREEVLDGQDPEELLRPEDCDASG